MGVSACQLLFGEFSHDISSQYDVAVIVMLRAAI
jgi:hypothetical protein